MNPLVRITRFITDSVMPKKQKSVDTSNVSYTPEGDIEVKPTVDFSVITALTEICLVTPDISQAVRNVKNTANTHYLLDFEFESELSPEKKSELHRKMQAELRSFKSSMYKPGNSRIFIDDCVSTAARTGAICVEWVPNRDLSGISHAVLVPTHTIRWYRTARGEWVLKQLVPFTMQNAKQYKSLVTLNQLTTVYRALSTVDGNIYGTSEYISIFVPLETQRNLMDGIRNYSKKINPLGFTTIRFKKPSREKNETAAEYTRRLIDLLDTNFDLYKNGLENGLAVGYMDEFEVDHTETTEGGKNVAAVNQLNEEQMFSSLGQDPALGGRTYSTTETYAGVVYDKFLNGVSSVQSIVADVLSRGFTLHLQMKGYPIKNAFVTFTKAKSLTNKTDAEADFMAQKVNHELYSDGIITQEQYAGNMGYDEPAEPEPKYPYASDVEAQSEAESDISVKENKNGERQTRGDKEKGVKKTEPRKNR